MRLAVITDVHLGPPEYKNGKAMKLTHLAEPLARRFVEHMREAKPDAVLNLGDVVQDENHDADLERYQLFCDLMRQVGVPVVHVVGNHDEENMSEAEMVTCWGRQGAAHYSVDVAGHHFVVLHTVWDHPRSVSLPDEQIEWLEGDLASTALPTIVLSHQALADASLEGNHWFERSPHMAVIRERARAREVIAASGKVRLALNGHAHWNHLQMIGGIPYLTIQSLTENVEPSLPDGRAAGSYALVDVEEQITVRVFGDQPCKYQFS